jgi:hypothetical protein
MEKPTVPQAAAALAAYYRLPGRDNGGVVHIITEDGNAEQSHADWCVQDARRCGTREDVEIAEMLAAMSRTQRRKLYARFSFYPETSDR